ncbi:MAG: ankyrin repeat domain-containing protein [Candidatus Eremiobacteraeota bacterium]|nr:ankyrin repeat domain-containing protein [Candidatus Eremiobacteraeota bacterium]
MSLRGTKMPVTKTALLAFVRSLDWTAVKAALAGRPELLKYCGKRGENLLHVCCGIDIAKRGLRPADSIKTAQVLLDAGLDIDREAFREGTWKATPLWYAVGRGKNLLLAKYLLKRGANPEYCMWAAAFNDSPAAIRLLVAAAAEIDPARGDTPLMFAVKWSRFAAAKALLECGANANVQDRSGKTALHYMVKKRSDAKHIRMFLEHGANPYLEDRDGMTVHTALSRARDPRYRELGK